MGDLQIGDERAHQAGLANAGGKRKAQRRKITLEIDNAGILAGDDVHRGGKIGGARRRHDLGNPVKDFETPALRRAQAQATRYGVDVTEIAHAASSPSNRPDCAGGGGAGSFSAIGRLATLSE